MNPIDANKNLMERILRLRAWVRRLPEFVLPPLLAAFAVWKEPVLNQLGRTHEAMLPLAIMLLLAAILHPQLRQYLVVTLCYGVACLAVHDAQRVAQVPLPAALNYDWVDALRPIGLGAVAVLAAVSGLAETAHPGAVWARRCYFGAAALYFTGLGITNYLMFHSWQAILLCITGITATGGCVMAHRVVAAEALPDEELPSDERVQQERDAAHHHVLQTKEWRDNLLSMIEERDTGIAGPSVDGSGSL